MGKKKLKQLILLAADICFICIPLVLLSFYLRPFEDFLDFTERFILLLIVHQTLAFVTSKNFLDSRKDELVAYSSFLELIILYTSYPDQGFIKSSVLSKYEQVSNGKCMMSKDILESMRLSLLVFDMQEITPSVVAGFKAELIATNTVLQTLELSWNNTLILKYFK